ncbi:MAG: hypothetical protein JSR77_07085 [Planctomycetes bacterium]|nr:hypothetical protein [Planctomycetota bacterium]
MTNRISFVCVSALLCLAGAASAAPNLLNNAGFESPLGFDFSNLSNWNGFFGGPAGTFLEAFNTTGATPHSGAQALVTTVRSGPGTDGLGAFTGHVQFVTSIIPGSMYELSVWARTNPIVTNGAEFRVEWQDAGGNEISRHNAAIQDLLTANFQQFSFTETAPAGAARAAIVLAVHSFVNTQPNADTSVAWDDASFSVVPAPSAAALLGVGALLVGRRRR